jgi:isopenicillin N synthase-like dioxygenase
MSSQYSIPVLDLEDFTSGNEERRRAFIHGVGSALREVGFFALTNHTISPELIQDGYAAAAALFELDETTKKSYEIPGIKGQRAYTSFGKEHAKDSKAPDLKEFWHVGQELSLAQLAAKSYPPNVWPRELPSFRPVMLDLYSRLEQCALSLLEACALYIGEEAALIRNMAVDGNSILRLIHYPPVSADRNPSSIRAGAHEDINLITLLIEATASGLEILDRHGQWIPVTTPKGCIIVDAGDMLQNLTNGFFKSTTHRVVNPNNSRERRYSMPFFVHARGEVVLDPLPSCIAVTGGEQLHPNITADDYLMQRLKEIGLA